MGVRITIESRGPVPGVMKSKHNAMSKASWLVGGDFWGDNLRSKHFQLTAFSEYGYRRRERSYEAKKERLFGHKRPLVYTGETEQRTEGFRTTSTRHGALVITYAQALSFTNSGSELTEVTNQEAKQIARAYGQEYDNQLDALQSERSTEQIS